MANEFNFQMVSGYSTLVQFQSGTRKIRDLHYNNILCRFISFVRWKYHSYYSVKCNWLKLEYGTCTSTYLYRLNTMAHMQNCKRWLATANLLATASCRNEGSLLIRCCQLAIAKGPIPNKILMQNIIVHVKIGYWWIGKWGKDWQTKKVPR